MVREGQSDPNFTFSLILTRSLQFDKNEFKRFKSKTENLFKKEMIGRKTSKKHPKSKLLVEYNNQTDFFQKYLFEEIIVIKIKIAMRFLNFCQKIHFIIGKVVKIENRLLDQFFLDGFSRPGSNPLSEAFIMDTNSANFFVSTRSIQRGTLLWT